MQSNILPTGREHRVMSEHTTKKTPKHTHANTRVLKNTHHTRTLTFADTCSIPSMPTTNFDIALTRAHVRTDIHTDTHKHMHSNHTCAKVLSHIGMSQDIHGCAMLHMWLSHVTLEKVVSRIGMRLGAHMNKSCHTYE